MKFVFDDTEISVTHPDEHSVLTDVAGHLRDGHGFALATINLDHLVKLRTNPAFRSAYAQQTMVVADGNPILWLSYLAHRPVSLVPGSDLVLPLVRVATEQGRPVVLFGSSASALDGAAHAMRKVVPKANISLCIAPTYGFDPTGHGAESMLQQINDQGPCLCLVALGAPKQELFTAFGRKIAPQAGFASVGAGVDFLSGHQLRAPDWSRRMALEWLWRAIQSPKRMVPRYLNCAAILPEQALKAWRLRERSNIRQTD